MSRKIAVMRCSHTYDDYNEVSKFIANHMTEFTEVSEEDYQLLIRNMYRVDNKQGFTHFIVENLPEEQIVLSIQQIKQEIEKEIEHHKKSEALRKKKAEEAKQRAAEAKAKKAQEALLKGDRLTRKQLFAKLKDEFEGNVSSG